MSRFTLNGTAVQIADDAPLARSLRDQLGHTGTKLGCEIGRCGACTLLVDGVAMNGCLLMGWQVEDRAVTTIEALEDLPVGAILARAMEEENAFQCGYCSPGVMMTLAGLLTASPGADDATLREALEGNICRCTGYHSILRGAARARDILKELS